MKSPESTLKCAFANSPGPPHTMRKPNPTPNLNKLIQSLIATSAIISMSWCSSVAAADDASTDNKDAKDGHVLLETLQNHIKTLQGYSFHSILETFEKDKPVKSEVDFYFKKEHQVRIEVRTPGAKNGSVVVEEADGKIRAQGGPKLFGMKMTINPDSRLLLSANGFNVLRSDLASLYAHAASLLSTGLRAKASAAPAIANGTQTEVLEIAGPNSAVVERVFISRETKTPVQWDLYRDNRLFSTLKISNFKADQVPSDDLFKL